MISAKPPKDGGLALIHSPYYYDAAMGILTRKGVRYLNLARIPVLTNPSTIERRYRNLYLSHTVDEGSENDLQKRCGMGHNWIR